MGKLNVRPHMTLSSDAAYKVRKRRSSLRTLVNNLGREPGDLVVSECDLTNLLSDADTNAFCSTSSFRNGVAGESNIFCLAGHFDCSAVFTAVVFDDVVLDHIAVGPEVDASVFIAEQNSKLAAVPNLVVAHHVVGVVVSDRHTVQVVAVNHVVFRKSILDTPAPEDALTISFESVSANDRSLRP